MDFSGMSLIKLKKEEMETQVKVLQLETQLEQERVHLGELRKRHYELGVSGADSEATDEDDSFPPPPPPVLLDSTPVPLSFSQMEPYQNTPSFAQTNPFAPTQTQSFSLPQSYTPTNIYTPAQSYTPSQPYIPAQLLPQTQHYTPSAAQSYLKPQTYSPSQPSSHASGPAQPQPLQTAPQSNTEPIKHASKKSNIFTKSGNLMKKAFKRGETGTGES
uniref:putative uncharacterized protein DDB_G0290521 isoform X2 n=1 Tax=Monopterus albus TaxID=43700 RepID=UPI0009B4E2B6|nr:putative uncharacterized protein DDB_G0290521 isoform X2 [Monopterus albus]